VISEQRRRRNQTKRNAMKTTEEGKPATVADRRYNEELLPCPFCGGVAKHSEVEDEDEAQHMGFTHIVGCHDLQCPAIPTTIGMTAAEAIGGWNTRKNGGAA
jgi:hypothetical protein